jgi:hypothetical protein
MRKSVLLTISAMVVMISCNNQQRTTSAESSDSLSTDSAAIAVSDNSLADSLQTDSVSFEKTEGIYKLDLFAEFPVSGGDSVVKAVREFINDFWGGSYDGPLSDGQAMAQRNGEMLWGEFLEMCGDADLEMVNELFLYKTVSKLYETSNFVTFQAMASQYTGGAHGIGYETGHTFSKKTGETFGYEMMQHLDRPAFKGLIKEGLKQFFCSDSERKDMSDEDLLNELVSYDGSADQLPLPDAEPYMTEKGVTFIYQPYEISYYAAGRPEFTIPYDVVEPYLKPQALKLFLNK